MAAVEQSDDISEEGIDAQIPSYENFLLHVTLIGQMMLRNRSVMFQPVSQPLLIHFHSSLR